jgi:hypothetical protein
MNTPVSETKSALEWPLVKRCFKRSLSFNRQFCSIRIGATRLARAFSMPESSILSEGLSACHYFHKI